MKTLSRTKQIIAALQHLNRFSTHKSITDYLHKTGFGIMYTNQALSELKKRKLIIGFTPQGKKNHKYYGFPSWLSEDGSIKEEFKPAVI